MPTHPWWLQKPELNKRHMFARRRSAERAEAAGKAVKNNHAAALLTGSSDLTLFRTKVRLPVTTALSKFVCLLLPGLARRLLVGRAFYCLN